MRYVYRISAIVLGIGAVPFGLLAVINGVLVALFSVEPGPPYTASFAPGEFQGIVAFAIAAALVAAAHSLWERS